MALSTIISAPGNVIGGTTDGAGNVLSGNQNAGVLINSFLHAPILANPTQSDGGALPNGAYFYVVTATTAVGETIGSNEVEIDLAGANGTVNLSWTAQGGATGYKLYRGTAAGEQDVLVATLLGDASTTFADVGAATTPGAPPLNNSAFSGDATGSLIEGNIIGADKTGIEALGNIFAGVNVTSSSNTTIGGLTAGARNIISGNGGAFDSGNGIILQGIQTTGSLIEGNYIGLDKSGAQRLGNAANGIFVEGASSTTIGGTAAGAGNCHFQ